MQSLRHQYDNLKVLEKYWRLIKYKITIKPDNIRNELKVNK